MVRFKLREGDCLEIMKEIRDSSIRAIITDLPYKITQNKWDDIIPFEPMWEQVHRILLPNGVFITTASQPFTSALIMSNLKDYRHEWIWIKNRGSNFANTIREPFKEHESVVVFSRGGWVYNKQMQERTGQGVERSKYRFNFKTDSANYGLFAGQKAVNKSQLRVPSSWQKFNVEVGLHPTQKPVGLYEYLIETYTNEDDVVVDIAMGSGTAGVAALRLCRRFIGMESNESYFQIASERIEEIEKGQKTNATSNPK